VLGYSGNRHHLAKTQGGLEVKGGLGIQFPAACSSTTRNPNIKSLRDLTDKNKIALPAVQGFDAGDHPANGGGTDLR